MEDFLLTLTASFVDTDTGEVLANAQFSKPLSLFTPDNYQKYFESALRGIRQGRKISLYVLFTLDRNLPKVKEQTFSF